MAWEQPKTDWYGVTIDKKYQGDRFNIEDYNRMKNNILFLQEISYPYYPKFELEDMGEDRIYGDFPYAEDMNKIFRNLKILNEKTVNLSSFTEWLESSGFDGYMANGRTMRYDELNMFEKTMLEIYEAINEELDKLPRLPRVLNGGVFR